MVRRVAGWLALGIAGCGGSGGGVDGDPVADAAANPDGGDGGGGHASAWILDHLAGTPVVTGDHTARTRVETPALVHVATGCCAKYAFDAVEEAEPVDPQIGFVDVTIQDLVTTDAFGGGIVSARAPGLVLYLSDVRIEPRWPSWIDYDTTNLDGMVLDNAAAIYAEDLTVASWNADSAIDNKAPTSQLVRFAMQGPGNRGIRYWTDGPHYLVDSTLENPGGLGDEAVMWFESCDTTVVRIYNSTFNGAPTVPIDLVQCNNGSAPQLEYLTVDPRTTGEMHAMFAPL
jgi:hypothetical protein